MKIRVDLRSTHEDSETVKSGYWANSRGGSAACGIIGRLPMEWSKCLIPLVNSKKVKVLGRCVAAPASLSMMQEIMLYISFYIHHSIFTEDGNCSWKLDSPSNIDTTIYPLLSLFKLLKKSPFQKAEFTPEELDTGKRALTLEWCARFGLSSFRHKLNWLRDGVAPGSNLSDLESVELLRQQDTISFLD
ncbi:putative HIRAN domain-containing protein [Helianthus debilis subsp. tardiflorus]